MKKIESLKAGLDMVEAIQAGELDTQGTLEEVEFMDEWIQMIKVRNVEGGIIKTLEDLGSQLKQ